MVAECPICWDSDQTQSYLMGHISGKAIHQFHPQCLSEWIKDHPTCPYCRDELSSLNLSSFPNPNFSWKAKVVRWCMNAGDSVWGMRKKPIFHLVAKGVTFIGVTWLVGEGFMRLPPGFFSGAIAGASGASISLGFICMNRLLGKSHSKENIYLFMFPNIIAASYVAYMGSRADLNHVIGMVASSALSWASILKLDLMHIFPEEKVSLLPTFEILLTLTPVMLVTAGIAGGCLSPIETFSALAIIKNLGCALLGAGSSLFIAHKISLELDQFGNT